MLRAPWLILPAKLAHDLSPWLLTAAATLRNNRPIPDWKSLHWRGLHFPNPLGISGGVDKNVHTIKAWWKFGCGFVEVGTVTPKPQSPNSGQIIARDSKHFALWNKMGFPNDGADIVFERLQKIFNNRPTPIIVNIGKNRNTPNEEAWQDYCSLIQRFQQCADVFAINISSPNTVGLRELLGPAKLSAFLSKTLSTRGKVPCLLKLSPDLSNAELKNVIDVSIDCGIDGWILTNTSREIRNQLDFPVEGGVSGAPLAARSRECLKIVADHLGPRKGDKLLISSGGIMSPDDVIDRLLIGANLVQVYTALVFHGPWFFDQVASTMEMNE